MDNYFSDKFSEIDALDINVEGCDFQVVQGSENLLKHANIKLIKVEFEMAPVWHDQRWFGDIDSLLREMNYECADIEIAYGPPASVRSFFNKGEPLWGKALYVPSSKKWENVLHQEDASEQINKALCLFISADLPARAFDLIDLVSSTGKYNDADDLKIQIKDVYAWMSIEHKIDVLVKIFKRVFRINEL